MRSPARSPFLLQWAGAHGEHQWVVENEHLPKRRDAGSLMVGRGTAAKDVQKMQSSKR